MPRRKNRKREYGFGNKQEVMKFKLDDGQLADRHGDNGHRERKERKKERKKDWEMLTCHVVKKRERERQITKDKREERRFKLLK